MSDLICPSSSFWMAYCGYTPWSEFFASCGLAVACILVVFIFVAWANWRRG